MTVESWRRLCYAHVQTWRPYTLCYPGMIGLAGAALAHERAGPWSLAAGAAAPMLGWIAAHYVGDYFDRELDAIDKPQRPIPSGRLPARTALLSGLSCAVALALLVAAVNWRALVLVVAALGGIVGYSRWFKGQGAAGNIVRGLLTVLAFLCGAMMVSPYPSWGLVPFALAFGVHDVSSNLVGTLRDVHGDRQGGYRTVPVRFGLTATVRLALLLYLMAIGLAIANAWLLPAPNAGYLALLFTACCGGVVAFFPLARKSATVSPEVALRSHEVLVLERLLLVGAVLAAGLGFRDALVVLVPVVLLSALAQVLMRSNYEFGSSPPPPVHTKTE